MANPHSQITIHHNISNVKPNAYNTVWVFTRSKRLMNTNLLTYVFFSYPGMVW